MFCNKCGAKIPDDAKFCNNCGEIINVQTTNESKQIEPSNVSVPTLMTTSGGIGNRAIYKSFGNNYKEKISTFVFYTPFDAQRTLTLINDAFKEIGFVKEININRNYFRGIVMMSIVWFPVYEFYITQVENGCRVRVVLDMKTMIGRQPKQIDKIYDEFLQEMFKLEPSVNFGISLSKGAPYVIAINQIGSNIATQTDTVSNQNPNVGGMLAGNFFFGQAGAIVGGMSGKTKSTSVTREVFSKNRLVSVIFNNGRVYEGEIREGTALYNEVMAKIL